MPSKSYVSFYSGLNRRKHQLKRVASSIERDQSSFSDRPSAYSQTVGQHNGKQYSIYGDGVGRKRHSFHLSEQTSHHKLSWSFQVFQSDFICYQIPAFSRYHASRHQGKYWFIQPENILLDNTCNVKICDLGWATDNIQMKRKTFCGTY